MLLDMKIEIFPAVVQGRDEIVARDWLVGNWGDQESDGTVRDRIGDRASTVCCRLSRTKRGHQRCSSSIQVGRWIHFESRLA